jgi:hypothetical protein
MAGGVVSKHPVPLTHQAERDARVESQRVGGLVAAWEEQVGLPRNARQKPASVQLSRSFPNSTLRRQPSSGGTARSRRPRSASARAGSGRVEIERTESALPPNGAKAAESRVQERLAVLRSSGAELAELERRVSSYRRGRPTNGEVYYVAQNMEPVILRQKRPKTVYAVSRINNERYRAERDQVLARRNAEIARQMQEHIASRDRQELKRQAMKNARIEARRIKQEKEVLVACVLASRFEVVRANVEVCRLERIMEHGRISAIRKLQNAWRTIRIAKSEAKLGDAARVIQRGARMFLWRLTLKRKCLAASKIIAYTKSCSGAGSFVKMLQTYRSRVVLIQRMWKRRKLTNAATVVALHKHWDRTKKVVAAEKAVLQEAAVMLKRSGNISPELEEQVAAVLPSFVEATRADDVPSSSAVEGYPTKSLKDRRKDAKNEALAAKHAMLDKIEARINTLPQFSPVARGKDSVSKKQRQDAIEEFIRSRQEAHRTALRAFYVEWNSYEKVMVGVERQLATRRALGASMRSIERPERPVKPRLALVPPDLEMWAMMLDCEQRAKKGGRRR